jgi:hypothetical protein
VAVKDEFLDAMSSGSGKPSAESATTPDPAAAAALDDLLDEAVGSAGPGTIRRPGRRPRPRTPFWRGAPRGRR